MSYWKLLLSIAVALTFVTRNIDSKLIACNQPNNFTVQISGGRNALVYGSELTISYDPNVTVYTYPGTKAVNLLFNDSTIRFAARMFHDSKIGAIPELISWVGSGRILGVGELKIAANNFYTVLKPRLFLPQNTNSSTNLPYFLRSKVVHYVQSCMTTYLCEKLRGIRPDQLRFDVNLDKFGPLSATSNDLYKILSIEDVAVCESKEPSQQVDANILVDSAINEFTKKLKLENKYKIDLPNLSERFQTGTSIFTISGRFEATNGYFEDITTVVRKGDARLSNDGLKYSITAAFEFKTPIVKYNRYKISYAFFKFGKQLTADVQGLTVEIRVTFDFSEEQCLAEVDYIKVLKVGKLNLHLTGLGPLNNWISQLMTYFTKLWRDQAVIIIKNAFSKLIDHALAALDCKTYAKSMRLFT